jgi:hypothetical protein
MKFDNHISKNNSIMDRVRIYEDETINEYNLKVLFKIYNLQTIVAINLNNNNNKIVQLYLPSLAFCAKVDKKLNNKNARKHILNEMRISLHKKLNEHLFKFLAQQMI